MSAAQFRPGRFRPILTMLLVFVVLFVAWLGLEVYLALTARPNPVTDYGALTEAQVRAYQGSSGENVWPVLAEALRDFQSAVTGLRDEAADVAWGDEGYGFDAVFAYEESLESLRKEEADDASFEKSRYGALEAHARMSGVALARWDELGIDDKLDRLVAGSEAVRPMPDSTRSMLIEVELSGLGVVRNMARAIRARMAIARDAGDWDGYAASLERGLAVGRLVTEQSTIIDRLVGHAVRGWMFEQVRHDLAARALSERALALVSEVIERQGAVAPLAHTFDAELLMQLDAVQWTHDRRGRIMLDRVQLLDGSGRGGGGSKIVNTASIAFPRQSATEAWFKDRTERVKSFAAMSVRERRAAERRGEGVDRFDRIGWSQPLGRVLLPAYGAVFRADEQRELELLGVRAMLAIEGFRQETGRLSADLGELVPRWLDAPPEDPFAESAAPLVYRVLEAEGEAGSAYILYSVGYDGADNGGTPSERNALDALREGYAGTDFILSGTGE